MRRPYSISLLVLSLLLTQLRPALVRAQTACGEVPAAHAKTQNTSAKQQPGDKRVEKVRRVVDKVGVGNRITVFLENGDDLHGTVARVGAEDFDVAEVDLRQLITVRYEFVKKAREGYGGVNLITGKRASPRRGTGVAVFAGVMFMAVALPLILVASAKD